MIHLQWSAHEIGYMEVKNSNEKTGMELIEELFFELLAANEMKSAVELPNRVWMRAAAAKVNKMKSAVVKHEIRSYYESKKLQ